MRDAGVDAAVVVGGSVPPRDAEVLLSIGVRAVFTPRDFELAQIVERLVELAEEHRAARTTVHAGRQDS